ncbi:helix-turn-helix domain-containing protein [Actinomadura scrupuli]|uniref:helix-turn-helix domain-containing protein n=1 Tax=Actinomadura scrupuli TaxID=559629 RepID=UPI003D9872B6
MTAFYGWKVRTLREERGGWTQVDLGKKIALGDDAVSKLELGKSAPDDRTGELLDTTFDTGTYFTELAPLVRKERIPGPARSLAQSEAVANIIRIYEPSLITGLFQTEAYIRAKAETGPYADDVDEIVAQRLRRQEILKRKDPPRIVLITDEVALRRGIGGPEAFKAQLEHLEEATRQRNITIQVVPVTTTAYAGLAGAFTIMSFIEDPDVAFVDGANSNGQFIDRPDMVAGLMETYDLIRSAALPAAQSAHLIKEIRESL